LFLNHKLKPILWIEIFLLGHSEIVSPSHPAVNQEMKRSSPIILGKKEQALTGLRSMSGKVALDAPLLAEEMLFDPIIGQGIKAKLREGQIRNTRL